MRLTRALGGLVAAARGLAGVDFCGLQETSQLKFYALSRVLKERGRRERFYPLDQNLLKGTPSPKRQPISDAVQAHPKP